MVQKFQVTLIDPYHRSIQQRTMRAGLDEWLGLDSLLKCPSLFEAQQVYRPIHHGLPMDEISKFIGKGTIVPIYANSITETVYLVLHDDVADQSRKRPCFVLKWKQCRVEHRIARKTHFERAVLVDSGGDIVHLSRFRITWCEAAPMENSGWCTDGFGAYERVMNPEKCGYCGMHETVTSFQLCGGCKTQRYCSRKCQRAHWSVHRVTCKKHRTGGGGSPEPVLRRRECGYCGMRESVVSFQLCAGCKTQRYCSRKCQRAHWSVHRVACKKHRTGRGQPRSLCYVDNARGKKETGACPEHSIPREC